mmetsp:Transcript_35578/g.65849  ORF Transcript_35578/g.65849 Transcript_35578/m.65849 type:complete len:94 (+) Transcript_35578:181-462(+)
MAPPSSSRVSKHVLVGEDDGGNEEDGVVDGRDVVEGAMDGPKLIDGMADMTDTTVTTVVLEDETLDVEDEDNHQITMAPVMNRMNINAKNAFA